jgi:hypothetical protein
VNKLVVLTLVFALIFSGCSSPQAVKTPVAAITATREAAQTEIPTYTPDAAATRMAEKTVSAAGTQAAIATIDAININDVIAFEMMGSFNFFWEQANTDPNSRGYGLVRDRYPDSEGVASIASVGYALTAYLIGVEKGYITRQEGYDRANGTLNTLLAMDRWEGYFYHFVDMQTGKRAWDSEVSSIDTSILFMGILSAGQYFGGDVAVKAKQLYDGVNWPAFIDPSTHTFYMAYRPEKGYEGHWDFYAEQLMLYVLAAGSDTHPIDDTPYYTFTRDYKSYGDGKPFIHSWFGSIFTYQYSHAWIDFRGYADKKGVNWFDNSVDASLAQVAFATKFADKYQTLGPYAWGLSACDGPDGYNGTYGAPPSGYDDRSNFIDDTIPPSGAIGSILFVPEQAQNAMRNYYSIEKLKGKYGFVDAYNLARNWFDTDVIGIDKGVSLLMLANYENNAVYTVMMANANILKGLGRLQIKKSQ